MLLNQRSNAKTQEDMVKILHKRSQEYREMGRIFGAALAPAAPPCSRCAPVYPRTPVPEPRPGPAPPRDRARSHALLVAEVPAHVLRGHLCDRHGRHRAVGGLVP
jgi:hypothetical protein